MRCLHCGLESRKRFCGKPCYDKYRYRHQRKVEYLCKGCGERVFGSETTKGRSGYCRACLVSAKNARCSGPLSPVWKGGYRFWIKGKLGRDKDGLSWKVQRKLAWERDHYTCQDCGATSFRRGRPDCHHIVPYRVSFSHSLSNLKSLCQSCHKKAEAEIKELWGGKSFGGNKRPDNQVRCLVCEKIRKVSIFGKCKQCST